MNLPAQAPKGAWEDQIRVSVKLGEKYLITASQCESRGFKTSLFYQYPASTQQAIQVNHVNKRSHRTSIRQTGGLRVARCAGKKTRLI